MDIIQDKEISIVRNYIIMKYNDNYDARRAAFLDVVTDIERIYLENERMKQYGGEEMMGTIITKDYINEMREEYINRMIRVIRDFSSEMLRDESSKFRKEKLSEIRDHVDLVEDLIREQERMKN